MSSLGRSRSLQAFLLASVLLWPASAAADVVTLPASKDNTLYESATGELSNGAGHHLFAGNTAIPEIRRALIAFDVAGAVPAGSTITGVRLTLSMSATIVGQRPVSLHRAAADWGEGASQAPAPEGTGAPAEAGDATWLHAFFDTSFWSTEGGDFESSASATALVDQIGLYTWDSTASLVADVQAWLDDPDGNFGWILVGDEAAVPSTKRFDSSQNPDEAVRPALQVEFTPPGAGRVPDGGPHPGEPLTLSLNPGGDLTLAWGASCATTDTDFAVYEGVLGDFTSHLPRLCSTAGVAGVTLTPSAGPRYYLVVPVNGFREGSYGRRGDLLERPASVAACLPQSIAGCS